MASRGRTPPIVTVPTYLAAVRTMHAMAPRDIARALHVSPTVVRRWQRGTLVPTWSRLRTMTARFGGDAELLALGAALQRFCRTTGVSLEEAVRMVRAGRRTGPELRRRARTRDRRQLALPMGR